MAIPNYASTENSESLSSPPTRWIVLQIRRRFENISFCGKWLLLLLLFLLPCLLATLLWHWISLEAIQWLEQWSLKRKQLQWLFYYLIYVVFTLLCFPAAVFSLGAGFLFGPWLGAVITLFALSTVALIAFTLSRCIFYSFFYDVIVELFSADWLERWNVVMAHRAFVMTFLLRCSPLFPFTLTSFLLGITKAPLSKFLIATSLGILPEVIFLTHMGSLAHSLVQVMTHGKPLQPHRKYLLLIGLITSTLIVYAITRIAKKTLQQQQLVTSPLNSHAV